MFILIWWRRLEPIQHLQQTAAIHHILHYSNFLLLACYVPNVAKRSIWDQCKKKYILRTDRPTTDLSILNISNGHISARGRPIHFMFGSTVGFSGSADRMALFPVLPNGGHRIIRHGDWIWIFLENSNGDISAADRPIYSVFGSRMGFSESADWTALILVWPNSIGMWEKTMCEE